MKIGDKKIYKGIDQKAFGKTAEIVGMCGRGLIDVKLGGKTLSVDSIWWNTMCDPIKPIYDITSNIIAYEEGELDEDQTIELFQHLIDNGMAWTLQGGYGRAAMQMIEDGVCNRKV
jgi:hypothetical protein